MIKGAVNPRLEPMVQVAVIDAQGSQHLVEALLDTGYNGALALPTAIVTVLGLTWNARLGGFLADGSYIDFDVYGATLLWDGVPRVVDVEATGTAALLGTELLFRRRLAIDFEPGGVVEIDLLP